MIGLIEILPPATDQPLDTDQQPAMESQEQPLGEPQESLESTTEPAEDPFQV